MKIGDLFISLGFQITNQREFDDAEKGVERAALSAGKLTIAVNAVNVALVAMMTTAGRAGLALRNFSVTTGLSSEELQRWQRAGATVGIAADGITSAIESLQDTRAAFALGEPQAVGAWSLLGVSPIGNPFKVVSDVRRSLQGVQPMIAKALLSKIGLSSLSPLIQSPAADFERWARSLTISNEQIDRLTRFNAAWQSLLLSLNAAKNILASALAPAMTSVARGLEWVAAKLSVVVDWLSRGSGIARILRYVLSGVAIGFLAVGAAVAVVTVSLAALAAVLTALTLLGWASGISEIILGLTLAIAAVVLGVGALILLLDDLWVAAKGGKNAMDWLPITIDLMKLFQSGLDAARWTLDHIWTVLVAIGRAFKDLIASGSGGMQSIFNHLPDWMIGVKQPNAFDNMSDKMMSGEMRRSLGTINQRNEVNVSINGSGTPLETARLTGKSVKDELQAAARQAPARCY